MSVNENLYLNLVGNCLEGKSLEAENRQQLADKAFLLTPGREPLLYSQLASRTGKLHSKLLGLGVSPGDRVVVQTQKSNEAVVLYLACLRVGAIYIPLNTAYTLNEIEYFLGDAKPQLFVCEPKKREQCEALANKLAVPHTLTLGENGEGSLLEALEALADNPEVVVRKSDDLASILYTSGTAGRSKGAMLSHGNLLSNAKTLHQYWQWQNDEDVLLHALPIFHVHGLFVALHCAMLGRSSVHFLARFDVTEVLQKLPQSTVLMGVPTFYTRLLDEPNFNSDCCQKMRLFIAGSAPLLAETHDSFAERTGHKILERYGMTECGMITSNPYEGERIAGTVGFALPGVSARVCDDKGTELAVGETGVLEVAGSNVFSGYWQMPEKTAEEFRDDGYFITGDLSKMDQSGRITIVGRSKDLIISGGYNIYPKEIESEIDLIEGVKESAVIGIPHADFGESVVAVIVLDGSTTLTPTDILQPLQGRLAKFKQPKVIEFVSELPRNVMGKVQKAQLRNTYQNAQAINK